MEGFGLNYAKDAAANQLAQAVIEEFQSEMLRDEHFGGFLITSAGIRVAVTDVPHAETTLHLISRMCETIPVAVFPVENSLMTMRDVLARIDKDQSSWLEQGLNLSSWSLDVASNLIIIRLTSFKERDARLLIDHYGADLIRVVPESEIVEG